MRAVAPGEVVADLEDDFHHFRVTLRHDGNVVESVEAESIRWPWSTCPGAAVRCARRRAAQHPVDARGPLDEPGVQLHAPVRRRRARDHPRRTGRKRASVRRRGGCGSCARRSRRSQPVVGGRPPHAPVAHAAGAEPIDLPPELAGAPWRGGFLRWADEHLEPDFAEQACVLRRASDIGMGRGMPLDDDPRRVAAPGFDAGRVPQPAARRRAGRVPQRRQHPRLRRRPRSHLLPRPD